MLSDIIPAFAKKQSPIPMEDSLAVMSFIDAANRSRLENGKAMTVAPVSIH